MLSYLLTSATAEELRAALLRAGLEILTEGGRDEVARFLVSERGRAQDSLVLMIWLSGARQELSVSAAAVESVPGLGDSVHEVEEREAAVLGVPLAGETVLGSACLEALAYGHAVALQESIQEVEDLGPR